MQFMQTMESGGSSRGKTRSLGEGGEHITTSSVGLGDVIYIKLRRDSWWPAQVVDENSVSKVNKPRKRSAAEVLVRIYGSSLYMYADPIKYCREFEEMHKQNNSSLKEILLQTLEQDIPSSKLSKSSGSGSKIKANARKTPKGSGKQKDHEANSSKARSRARKDSYRSNNSWQNESPTGARSLRPRENLKQRFPSAKNEDKGKSHKQDEVEKEVILGKKRQPSPTDEKAINGSESMENPSKRNRLLNGNDLSDQHIETSLFGKSQDSSTRKKRVMENLGLSPPPGSPFQKDGGIS